MFESKIVYDPGVDSKYTEKITCLYNKEGKIYIGREDGVLECFKEKSLYSHLGFTVEFDYLENEDIKEKIVAIDKITDGGLNDIVFIANEKVMKVLKIRNDASDLEICNNEPSDKYRIAEIRKCSNIHSYVLNSLSLNVSGDYLITSDYIRINLWRPFCLDNMFVLRDIKSAISGGLVSVINSSKFSPFQDGTFAYSTSGGEIHLNDLDSAPRSQEILLLKNQNHDGIKSISDFSFVDPNLIVARSLNHVTLFDTRNPYSPLFCKELVQDAVDQNTLNSSDAIYERLKLQITVWLHLLDHFSIQFIV